MNRNTHETSLEQHTDPILGVDVSDAMTGVDVPTQSPRTPNRITIVLGRMSVAGTLLAAACGDSGTTETQSTTEATTAPTSSASESSSTTGPDNTTTGKTTTEPEGSNSTSGENSMSGEMTVDPTTAGITETTNSDPTGQKCMDDLECGEYAQCNEGTCACNENHTGDNCTECVEGAFLTTEKGCQDNPCDNDPNPCGDQSCIPNEETGEANCSIPAATIETMTVDCIDGPNNSDCLAGGNPYGLTIKTKNAEKCNLGTELIVGDGSPGVVDGIINIVNNTGEGTYFTGNTPNTVTEITATCTGNGGPSAPSKTEVTNK